MNAAPGRQWQAMQAARIAGASWDQIGAATGTTGEDARVSFVASSDRRERYGVREHMPSREVE